MHVALSALHFSDNRIKETKELAGRAGGGGAATKPGGGSECEILISSTSRSQGALSHPTAVFHETAVDTEVHNINVKFRKFLFVYCGFVSAINPVIDLKVT